MAVERQALAPQRGQKSYVLRQGRLTRAQERALQELYPVFGVPAGQGPLDLHALYGRRAPLWLEIGFGAGETLAGLAREHPELDFLGLEVHGPGVGRLLLRAREWGLANLRVARADAVPFLSERLAEASLQRVLVLFPDPWPKKRHHKRRLIQPVFVSLLMRRLVPGGILHLATDWVDYAEQMRRVLGDCEGLELVADSARGDPCPAYRLPTRFESRGRRLGHDICDLVYRRVAAAGPGAE